jgi:hypothetical protein
MRRYKIENEALATEIVNLHKHSTHWSKKRLLHSSADLYIINF